MEGSRFHAAIYLAGYVIECYLKHLICQRDDLLYLEDWEQRFERRSKRPAHVREKRGHDLEWLLQLSRLDQPLLADAELRRQFAIVNRWSVDMRYRSAAVTRDQAEGFVSAVGLVRAWLQSLTAATASCVSARDEEHDGESEKSDGGVDRRFRADPRRWVSVAGTVQPGCRKGIAFRTG